MSNAQSGQTPPANAGGSPNPGGSPSADELKKALKAFRKRLKLTQLDEDSRIAGGPLSSGSRARITAIMPPNQFSLAVWDELVRQGKLKRAGGGTYELIE